MRIQAMTYNIRSGRNLANELDIRFAAEVLGAVDPDFVGLNEVRSHTEDVGPVNQAEQLGKLLGWNWVFGRSIDHAGGEYGNAFLSKHPILQTEVIHIPDAPREQSKYFEHRTILRAVVDVGGVKLTVLASHFGLSNAERSEAVRCALDCLARESNPVILMGDFNLSPDDPLLVPVYEILEDTAEGKAVPLTCPSGTPRVKIDYIFVDARFNRLGLETVITQNSDHLPLVATLELKD